MSKRTDRSPARKRPTTRGRKNGPRLCILVTGGRGALGPYLAAALERAGHEVFVADRAHHHAPRYARCDVGAFRQLERLWTGGGWPRGYTPKGRRFDLVYHLAAEFGRWNGEDYYEDLWRTNAVGTKNLIRMQEREGFRAVYFSSSEIYGDYEGLMREDVPERAAIRPLNDYAMTKWVNEMQVRNSERQFGTQSVRVRLFNVYGPGEFYSPYRSVICTFCYHALHGRPLTVFRGHRRTESYVTDTARTLARIAGRFRPGEVYNIGGTQLHAIEEYARIILKLLRKRPQGRLRLARSEAMTTRSKLVDCSKAVRELGHRGTVPLEEGLRRTLAWMKEVYRKPGSHRP